MYALSSVLFASLALAASSSSSSTPESVSVTFPAYGVAQTINGTLLFTSTSEGVQISSQGNTALENFPAGEGPFLFHGNA
jgi:hypothetical protein